MRSRTLEDVLATVPRVYDMLGDALTPGRTGDGPTGPADPIHRPAPARLDAVEHRHLLLRGLRWWVDAVELTSAEHQVGDSPARMCALLIANLSVMDDGDRTELHGQLTEWLHDAYPLVGEVDTPKPRLPLSALDQRVPVHVAATALGVSVSTVQRRTPGRTDGTVVLRDAAGPECPQSWLPEPWCAHCRPG